LSDPDHNVGFNPANKGSTIHRQLLNFHQSPYKWTLSKFYNQSKKLALYSWEAEEEKALDSSLELVRHRIQEFQQEQQNLLKKNTIITMPLPPAASNTRNTNTPPLPPTPPRTAAATTTADTLGMFSPTRHVNIRENFKKSIVLELNDDQSIFVSFPPAVGGLKPKFRFAEDGRSIGYYTPKIKETERPDGLLAGHPNCDEGSKWHNMVEVEMKRQLGIQPNGKFPPLPTSDDDYELYWSASFTCAVEKQFYKPGKKELEPTKKPKMQSNGSQIWFSFFLKKITETGHTDIDEVDAVDQACKDLATKMGLGCKYLLLFFGACYLVISFSHILL
jgi:hypothetical protein